MGMGREKGKTAAIMPSSNWLALQKTLRKSRSKVEVSSSAGEPRRKKRRLNQPEGGEDGLREELASASTSSSHSKPSRTINDAHPKHTYNAKGRREKETVEDLRDMVLGKVEYTDAQKLPGKYLSIDCEMVGVGIDGAESSLARVSIVNFYGYTLLDEYVRQRERVVDYRTRWSGIRAEDMRSAKPFNEIQQRVAELMKDRILIGHAVHNDLKALLLSHPHTHTRDTQLLSKKHNLTKSPRIALRTLVAQELGLAIQEGEHDSVIDARATMGVYRLHKKEWEKDRLPIVGVGGSKKRKRKRPAGDLDAVGDEDEDGDEDGAGITPKYLKRKRQRKQPDNSSLQDLAASDGQEVSDEGSTSTRHSSMAKYPSKAPPKPNPTRKINDTPKKGISSGLSTIIRRGVGAATSTSKKFKVKTKTKGEWWKELPMHKA